MPCGPDLGIMDMTWSTMRPFHGLVDHLLAIHSAEVPRYIPLITPSRAFLAFDQLQSPKESAIRIVNCDMTQRHAFAIPLS